MAGRDVELLIHISAPSLARDDALYRSLATAYLDFQPLDRLAVHDDDAITGCEDALGGEEDAADQQAAESQLLGDLHNSQDVTRGQSQHMSSHGSAASSMLPNSQTSAAPRNPHFTRSKLAASSAAAFSQAAFSQASFASLDGHASPRLRTRARANPSAVARRRRERPSPTPPPDASHAPPRPPHPESSLPGEIPDSSSQWFRPLAAFSSPTVVMDSFLAHFESSYGSSSEAPLDHPSPTSPREEDARGRRHSGLSSPVSPSATRLAEAHRYQPPDFRDPGARDSSPPSPSPTRQDEAPSTTTTAPHLHTVQVRTTPSQPPIKRPASPPPSSPDISRIPATPIPTHKPTPRSTSHTIRPPPPPTSTSTTTPPFLPPSIARLAAEIGPSRYRPRTQTRPLRALERGYWRLHVPEGREWEAAWEFLRGYVGRGRAGWGVWCWRELIGGEEVGGEEGGGERGKEQAEEWRVYCWGGVVAEVYLLLYLASARRVGGWGACWVDGGGEVVVRMGGGLAGVADGLLGGAG